MLLSGPLYHSQPPLGKKPTLVITAVADVASAQDYPNRPVRVVTSAAGGGSDFAARMVAQGIAGPLGQQVIVDNRGSAILSSEFVSKAPADGYTLLVNGSNSTGVLGSLHPLRFESKQAALDFIAATELGRDK